MANLPHLWVPGWEGLYGVSSDGRVFSCRYASPQGGTLPRPNPTEILPYLGKRGYLVVSLGRARKATVHSLVAKAFIGPRPEGAQVRHLDGNKLNNHIDNLVYGTDAENKADMVAHGRTNSGEKNPFAKLDEAAVLHIRLLVKDGASSAHLAEMYKVSVSTIDRIKKRETWRHL